MSETKHLFIIGAQRCGTTYLYRILNSHPEVEMAKPVRPEPKYFLRDDILERDRSDYLERHFSDTGDVTWYGEKSTSYIESKKVPGLIKQWFSDVRIIVSLRNPIMRAISNYTFSKRNGLEDLPMKEAFLQEETRRDNYDKSSISVSPYAYLERGKYINYLREWEKFFPRENMEVLIFEEFTGNLDAIQQLFSNLGIDKHHIPQDIHKPVNSSFSGMEEDIPADLITYLQDYFAEPNAALEEWLGRSINWSESS